MASAEASQAQGTHLLERTVVDLEFAMEVKRILADDDKRRVQVGDTRVHVCGFVHVR